MYHGHEEHERHGEREEGCGCGGHHEGRHEGGHEHGFGHWHHHGCCCMRHHGYGMGFGMGMHRGGMPGFGMGMGFGFRRFISRDEIVSRLEEYLRELQSEAKAVEERIAEIKKRGEGRD